MDIPRLSANAVAGKVVVITCNLDVPVENGTIIDDTRIIESIPTLDFLVKSDLKRLHILAKMGRPKGQYVEELSQKVLVEPLQDHLGVEVEFRNDFTPGEARVQLHENVRFHPGERKNDPAFVEELQKMGGEVFVMDAFATAHREEASVVGLAQYIPSYAGFLMEKEMKALGPFLTEEKIEGLTIIAGGAKMETKVPVLEHFVKIADNILVGGALSNTFQVAQGYDIGESWYEEEFVDKAREVMELAGTNGTGFHIPVDVICADSPESSEIADMPLDDVCGDAKIFDIGPHTVLSFEEILAHSKVVIWNGPLGMFEKPLFQDGTRRMLEFMAKLEHVQTILGGGDTLEALKKFNIPHEKFSHVSTGGGAMLEFLSGKVLPGVAALGTKNKPSS